MTDNIYAVFSDIHGNYPALKAAAHDARNFASKQKAQLHYLILGDVVDYGPQPNECMEWLARHQDKVTLVQGNHDKSAAAPFYEPPNIHGVGSAYWPITFWTRRNLAEKWKTWLGEWQTEAHVSMGADAFTLFHSSLIRQHDRTENGSAAMQNIRRMRTKYGLFGHTHYQGYFTVNGHEDSAAMYVACGNGAIPRTPAKAISTEEWHQLPEKATLLNPGSVGQPRQPPHLSRRACPYQPHAAYLLIYPQKRETLFMFRRVPYDVQETISQFDAVSWPVGQKKSVGQDIYIDREALTIQRDVGALLSQIEPALTALKTVLIKTLENG